LSAKPVEIHKNKSFKNLFRRSSIMKRNISFVVALVLLLMFATVAQATYQVVVLHPSSFPDARNSRAYGAGDGQQVGDVYYVNGMPHALLWSGTAESVVDLHPDDFDSTRGSGASGGKQVGYGYGPITGGNHHGLLWSGTAASVIDLHPSGFEMSAADRISGSRQVGHGITVLLT
jgi:hypothetical protein